MAGHQKFLDFRFVRRLQWKESEEGKIIVFRPRFGESKWARSITEIFGLSDYKIRLDEIGASVWRLCDGETPASEIVEMLRKRFGEKVKPAEKRLETFIRQMERAGMIQILAPDSRDGESAAQPPVSDIL